MRDEMRNETCKEQGEVISLELCISEPHKPTTNNSNKEDINSKEENEEGERCGKNQKGSLNVHGNLEDDAVLSSNKINHELGNSKSQVNSKSPKKASKQTSINAEVVINESAKSTLSTTNTGRISPKKDPSSHGKMTNQQRPCWYNLNSHCMFGDKCRNLHSRENQRVDKGKVQQREDNYSKYLEGTINQESNTYRPQGLPNIKVNLCFALSIIHMLSTLTPLVKEEKRKGLETIIHKTANILNGRYERSLPEEVSQMIWTYISSTWPDYAEETQSGRNRQNDAAEFLVRLLSKLEEENKETTNLLKSKINSTRRCTNEKCSKPITTSLDDEYLLRTTEIPNNTKISLQTIVDNFIPQLTTRYDTRCDKCGSDIEETNTLRFPTPIMMIHIDKVVTNENKTETEVEINEEIKIQTTENPLGEPYNVTDVIIHYGTPTNGHYVTTHYNEDKTKWEKIDDEKYVQLSNIQAERLNRHGVIYVLKRSGMPKTNQNKTEDEKYQDSSKNTTEAHAANQRRPETKPEEKHPKDWEQPSSKLNKTNDGFTTVTRRNRERVKNPWEMISKQDSSIGKKNPYWSISKRPEYYKYETNSNKRHYQDRDEPTQNKLVCWWHKNNRCKFSNNCWYSHKEQPFRAKAQ